MATGVTVLPEHFQNEGVENVVARLAAARVDMIATSPYVMEPSEEKGGSREPPIDAGAGSVRLLDRPLWGKRELFVRTAPSFAPDKKLYSGLRYQPAETSALTAREGAVIKQFLRAAQSRHIQTYLQVQAAIPPGYRVQFGGPTDDDKPRLPDGRVPPRRLANNGSLASPHILDYAIALTRDLVREYPDIDGIRYDWPEYPPYFLDDVFLDFGPHCAQAAARMRFDFPRMQNAVLELYRLMHGGLTNAHLERTLQGDGGRNALLMGLIDHPALLDWLRFKGALVSEFAMRLREALPARIALTFGVFPPPFSTVSGMQFSALARHASAIHCKLYTMHWPVIFRFYGDALLQANPGLDEGLLVEALSRWLEIQDPPYSTRLADYRYPEPDEPHPVGLQTQIRKVREAQRAAGTTPVFAFVHGYGPVDDFARRLAAGRTASPHGVWVNRYGYLRNEKVTLLGNPASPSARQP
ncbi:MAG TPA: hypothetical protein VFQ91_16850 [Bryobacteraceae bacterium]|nr:hypothetical protein [Bryobacteraceae bacterium]